MDADPLGEMLDMVETQNHLTAKWLQEHGCGLASEGMRFLKRISVSDTALAGTTQTCPNTREHQDLLQKCSTAGVHFRLTGGGDVVTTSDWIMAHERKAMPALLKEAQKIKTSKIQYKDIEEKAVEVYSKDYCDSKKLDLQTAIQYKEGPVPDDKIDINKNKPELKTIYEEKFLGKRRDRSKLFEWTEEEEANLHALREGEIPDYKLTAVWNGAIEKQIEFLATKHKNLPFARRLKVHKEHRSNLSEAQKRIVSDLYIGIEPEDNTKEHLLLMPAMMTIPLSMPPMMILLSKSIQKDKRRKKKPRRTL